MSTGSASYGSFELSYDQIRAWVSMDMGKVTDLGSNIRQTTAALGELPRTTCLLEFVYSRESKI